VHWAGVITGLLLVQVMLGALVAGLKAGLAYNTWPLMDGRLVPEGLGVMQPWYLNLFENAMTVQFNHRAVAYLLVIAVLWQAMTLRRREASPARTSAFILATGVLAQAALGIWTLLAQVPIALGLAHQAGAAAVFGLSVWHLHAARHPHAR
jgi:cytochrome c oxidase assembly protein subunit 15